MSGDKDDDKKDDSKPDDKKAGSGFGSISEFFTHLFTSPFQMIAGLGKGVFSNTILNPIGVLTTGGIIALLGKFAPSLVAWGLDKIGGEKLKARVNEDLKSGARGWIVDCGLAALVVNATMGGVSGVASEALGSAGDKEPSGMAKAGSILGSAAMVAGISVLAFKLVNSNGVGYAGTADASSAKQPTIVPTGAGQGQTPTVPHQAV